MDRPRNDLEDELNVESPEDPDDEMSESGNRPAGPDYGAGLGSALEDETPGSQGEIESGSEGDFGDGPQ